MDQGSSNRLMFVIILVLAIVCTALLTINFTKNGKSNQALSNDGFDPATIRDIVLDTIRKEPTAIITALREGQRIEQEKAQVETSKRIRGMRDQIENDGNTPIVGNPKGDVTVVEFFDYSCGYCKRVTPTLLKLLEEDKNLRIVLKEFPILGPNSEKLSKTALAVNALHPDKYWDIHLDFLKKSPSTDAQIAQVLSSNGIDADKIKAEINKPLYAELIRKNRELGASVGVRGTPAFIINGEFLPGTLDIDTFKQQIKAARK